MQSVPAVPQLESLVQLERHVPLTVHALVALQPLPQVPPQPSGPHTRPLQFGVQVVPPPVHVPAALQV